MRLTLLTLLVVGTAAVLVSGQENNNRRQARARFRALAEAARSGDRAAQDLLKSRRRQRPRTRPEAARSSAVPSRPVFQDAVAVPVEPEEPIRVRVPVRRNRVRAPRPTVQEVTTFRPTTLFSPTPAPEQAFPDTEESIFTTNPFTEAPIFDQISTVPVTEAPVFRSVIEQTPVPTRHRFRPQSRRPVDDFSLNFDLEPHRALQTGLEVGSRSEKIIPRFGNDRTTEPPVETIRRYSYFDEQGNYVFGYEAADGSFKEEVRGLDCVVNGKYGYVDPDGIRREFTYTSGNKCDPNAVVDPETQEVPVLPLNDQFLQQTQEQQLTETELEQLSFNRRRRPVQSARPQQQSTVSDTRRRQPKARPTARPIPRPAARPTPRPTARPAPRPSPRPVQEPQLVFRPVTEAPRTQASAPAFTPPSFQEAQEGRFPARRQEERQPPRQQSPFAPEEQLVRRPQPRPQPTFAPEEQLVRRPQPRPQPSFAPEEQLTRRPQPRPQPSFAPEEQLTRRPQPTRAPAQEQNVRQSTHQAFQPPEGPSFRPTPKPVAFDFDREFNNLFSNFAGPRPTPRTPAFTPTARPRPRPTPAPTSRPPPPPPPPTTRPTFKPVTTVPVTARPQTQTQTQGGGHDIANQLVFDSVSGTFKNVKVKTAHNSFLPKPAPNPFAPRPSAPSRPPTPALPPQSPRSPIPSSPPTHPSTVGRPLPLPTQPAAFNPANHFVINQNGRSPAAAEFDKFFSQFNLQF